MLRELIGIFFICFGVFFSVMGVAGLIRFPDVYSRIHASGKVSTLGIVGLLIGAAFLFPDTALKGIVLAIFLVSTAPVASHAIANAAHHSDVPMHNPIRNDLEEAEKTGQHPSTRNLSEPSSETT
jgi:multicomponent Na+:H+ antiporter subunit G